MSNISESSDETSSAASDKGWTQLARAAEAGNIDEVEELLAGVDVDVDIDVDMRDYNGLTPLALAARNGHAGVVERLLAHGADPGLRDLQHVAPLWYAARSGYVSIVRLFLASGRLLDVNPQPINLAEHESETPLAIALKEGHRETAELLARADNIDASVKISLGSCESEKLSILGLAIRDGYEDVALALLGKCNPEYISGSEDSAGMNHGVEPASKLLVLAAGAGCLRTVRELLTKHSADVNAVHGYTRATDGYVQQSPLMAASKGGHTSVVRFLLDTEGIQPCVSAYLGVTALIVAAEAGFVDVVKLLAADARVDADYRDEHGRTALSHAAEHAREAVVAQLLATRAVNPDSQDDKARTPLSWAVDPDRGYGPGGWQPYERSVRMLLANSRVSPNSRDSNGDTPLSRAANRGGLGLVRAILEHPKIDLENKGGRVPLVEASGMGHADVVQVLLNTGRVNVNAVSPSGQYEFSGTALTAASSMGRQNVVQLLLSAPGIDPNVTDEIGHTPLMMAAGKSEVGVVKQLLAAGVDLNIQDEDGETALSNAARPFCFSEGVAEVMRALVEAPGIDANLADKNGRTALSLAAEAGNAEQVKILLKADGIDLNARDTAGRGPLSWVFTEDRFKDWKTDERKEVMQQLLCVPAVDPNAEDAEGLTPLLRAIQFHDSTEFVELLLSRADVDVNQKGLDGLNPLAFAKRTCNTVATMLLRARGATASDDAESDGSTSSKKDLELTNGIELLQRPSSSSSRSSSTGSDSFLDRPVEVSGLARTTIRSNIARERRLPLGEQQAYIAEWAAKGTDASSLCLVCMEIDLDAAFSSRHTERRGRVIADLGRVDEAWEKRTCPLCRLFAAVCPRPSPDVENMKGGHKLVTFSTTQSWLCHDELACWQDFEDTWVDTMVLAVVSDSVLDGLSDYFPVSQRDRDLQATDLVQGVLSAGLIGRLGSNCSEQKNAITIPRSAADRSDARMRMRTARDWISCCRQNHSRRCNPRRLATIPHFYLIECSTQRIVKQKDEGSQVPYVALSYVWGQPPPQQQQQQQQQKSLGEEAIGVVEAVIKDAIRVTLELGYEYLWADRYCVMQTGNEAIKQEQLRHMHTVYSNAEVTLVAASGTDASAGLPGAPGRPRRTQQPEAFVQGHALVCIPPDPSLHIRSASTWATRGWTYQEGLLTRRRLYFSKYEMSYECRDMLCREALRLPPAVEQSMSGRTPRLMDPLWMYDPYRLPMMSSGNSGTGLFDLLEAYSTRQLSFPSDALNAMLGILQVLAERKDKPVYHVCGVPILCVEGSEFNSNGDRAVATRLALDGFVKGLCWSLQQPAHRRPGFPSWSWTGWQGVVKSMHGRQNFARHTYGCSIDVSIVPWNHNGGGGVVPWNRYYDQLHTADDATKDLWSGQQHVLQITASAATVRFRKATSLNDNKSVAWIGTVCAGDCVWQGEFSLTRKAEGDDAESQMSLLLLKPWTGIVLGSSCRRRYDILDTHVLVVKEQEQKQQQPADDAQTYWERFGLLKLERCTLKDGMLEQRTWLLA